MSKRKPIPRKRAVQPGTELLEDRQLLSATVSGFDSAGDQWTLKLLGPGTLVVTKQNGADGNPAPLDSTTDINTITIGGTNPQQTRLIGTVKPAAGSDGRVFFQNFVELANKSEGLTGGDGPLSIDMPNFWLANTTPSGTTPTPTPPSIKIPDGVDTFDFGGVDTTHNQETTTSSSTSDTAAIELGLPLYGGTRIIVNQVISSTQQAPPASGSTTPTTIQHAVFFNVSGRLDLFQANSIVGDATNPPGQFQRENSAASGVGGTWVVSGTSGTPPFFVNPQTQGGISGQVGNIRVGGNATNFTSVVFDGTNAGNAKLANFSIGGETNNVLLVAPNGARNLAFGLGMDNVEVYTHVINTLTANRGALNSIVAADRTISRAHFGGDVQNTTVESGVQQNFGTIINTIDGQATVSAFSPTPSPAPAPHPLNAQIGGGMQVLVAGDVTDSVFAASVQPGSVTSTSSTGTTTTTPQFGTPQQLVLPGGHITGKVEGKISNSNATPDMPNKAFYAQSVHLTTGPISPPNVPQAPYTGHQPHVRLPGLHVHGKVAFNSIPGLSSKSTTTPTPTPTTTTTTKHASVPKGPKKA
jgi:hypothetical protein